MNNMNQDIIKNIINILIAIMVIVGVGMGIFFVISKEEGTQTGDSDSTSVVNDIQDEMFDEFISDVSPETAQIITLLNKLQQISLNHSIVERKDFNALNDITVIIPSEPVGTTKPFEAL